MITGNTELYADQGWPEIERVHAAKITLLDRQVGRMWRDSGAPEAITRRPYKNTAEFPHPASMSNTSHA